MSPIRLKARIAIRLFAVMMVIAGSSLLTVACILGEFGLAMMDEDATNTSMILQTTVQAQKTIEARATEIEETKIAYDLTSRAYFKTLDAIYTQDALSTIDATPPELVFVSFPAEIPDDRTPAEGMLGFRDPGGDINKVYVDVVSATSFPSFSFDPFEAGASLLASGNRRDGKIKFSLWCQGQQDVVLRLTLGDRGGHRSQSLDIQFSCR